MKRGVSKGGFTLIEIMIAVAIIGILSSIAVPNYLKFQAKSRQAEARVNLGAIHTMQIAYFSANDTFAGTDGAFHLINFTPIKGKNRYNYIMDTAIYPSLYTNFDPSLLPPGIASTGSGFTCLAAGNLDNDPFLDVWGINKNRIIRNMIADETSWHSGANDLELD